MTVSFIRVLFVLLSAVIGYQIGFLLAPFKPEAGLMGAGIGSLISVIIIMFELAMSKISLRGLSAAVFGLLMALIVSKFVTDAIDLIEMSDVWSSSIKLVAVLVLAYIGMVFAIRGREEFSLIIPYVKLQGSKRSDSITILDTSSIVDGRIADIVSTKFIEGHFVVPKFVLRELHQLADSSDSMKRNRGRRGLDVLGRLRKNSKMNLRIHEQDFPEIHGVDAKIVKLAGHLEGRVLTTDINLNRVAEIQGVSVLNLNDLSNALRPVVLPGERLDITVIKDGKERDQGVAYLNDGTMVVVENGRHMVGRQASVTVTSVLQTSAGRMIFTKIRS